MFERKSQPRWNPLKQIISSIRIDDTNIQLYYDDNSYRIIEFIQHLYEQEIGRELMPHEFVIQTDGNNLNYKLENLRLYVRHPDWPLVLEPPVLASKRLFYRISSYKSKTDGRFYVQIFDRKQNKVATSRARFTMEQALGRVLITSENADHINDNKIDDDINNLQVLSHLKNLQKSALLRGYRVGDDVYGNYNCCLCHKPFTRLKRQVVDSNNIYCSNVCSGKASNAAQNPNGITLIKLKCHFCNNDFFRSLAKHNEAIKNGVAKFRCSNKCTEWNKPKPLKLPRKTITFGKFICDFCSKDVIRDVSRVESKKKRGFKHIFCDSKCAALHRNNKTQ